MKISRLYRHGLGFALAAAFLAGCGAQSATTGAVPIGATATTQAREHAGSWMLPEAKGDDLVYLSSNYTGNTDVFVYSYPKGKLVGTLSGVGPAEYECADANGDVYIPKYLYPSGLYEYAHGGSQQIKYLPLLAPFGCSVDPTTGNLAAVAYDSNTSSLFVYPDATGSPAIYSDPTIRAFWDVAYDNAGNLFVVGYRNDQSGTFALEELPKGGNTLQSLTLYGTGNEPYWTPILWDGKYLALESARPINKKRGSLDQEVIQRLRVSGNTASLVQQVYVGIQAPSETPEFWLQDHVLVSPTNQRGYSAVASFRFPSGKRIRTLKMDVNDHLTGAVISVAPSRSRTRR